MPARQNENQRAALLLSLHGPEVSAQVAPLHCLTLCSGQVTCNALSLATHTKQRGGQKSDDPEEFRAIGWAGGQLRSVICEIRRDSEGEVYRLITEWNATKQETETKAEQV